MSIYGLQIRGASGSFQFDGVSLNMSLNGIFSRNLKAGRQNYGASKWGYWRGWDHDFSLKSGSELYALASDQWIRVGVRVAYNGWYAPFNKEFLHQDSGGGGGKVRVYSFKPTLIDSSDVFGVEVRGSQSGTLGNTRLMKIIGVFELAPDIGYWSYKAPPGVKIAVMVGGGRIQRRDVSVSKVYRVEFRHIYSKITENGTKAEISFRDSFREDIPITLSHKLDQSQIISLRVAIVDITLFSDIPDF